MITAFTFGASNCNVRQDPFGRIVIDECASDHEHLTAPAPAGQERQQCRALLEDEFRRIVGRKGALFMTVMFVDELTPENIDEVAPQVADAFREQARRGCQEIVDTNRAILEAIKAKPEGADGE